MDFCGFFLKKKKTPAFWYQHSAVLSSVLAQTRSMGDLQGLSVVSLGRKEFSCCHMGPRHSYLLMASNGKPAVLSLGADNFLS